MQNIKKISNLLKALASEQRLKIVEELLKKEEPQCYCEMTDRIKKDRSVIYRHFKKLEEAGVLEVEKRGKRLEGVLKNKEKIEKLLEIAEEVIEDED